MKNRLIELGYAPVRHELDVGAECVGVILPISRHPGAVADLVDGLAAVPADTGRYEMRPLGRDMLLYWPNIPY